LIPGFVAANKTKVLFGLLKEPDINIPLDDSDEEKEGEDKPKVPVDLIIIALPGIFDRLLDMCI